MKKVFVSGNFNIIHPGHIRLLKYAKSLGNKLIVGIYTDKNSKSNAFIKENLRLSNVKDLSFVDEVILVNNTLKTLNLIKPDLIVKGKEFRDKKNIEQKYIRNKSCKLIFSSGPANYFSTKLFEKDTNIKKFQINTPKNFLTRHGIKKEKILELLSKINNLKTLVIGDIIVDEYVSCDLLGSSNEEPCLVLNKLDSKKFIGGSGIVASHASNLGSNTRLISVTGNDTSRTFLKNQLNKNKIKSFLINDPSRKTTVKQRFKIDNRSIIKISSLMQDPISKNIQDQIIKIIKKNINDIDLIILSDFNYGCLPQRLVKIIIKLAKSKKIFIAADSQSSSQTGDVARFKNVNLITPTEKEARLSVKNHTDGLITMIESLKKISKANNVILTLGSEGILIKSNKNKIHTDRIEALNKSPKDVAGSGDALLVISSLILLLSKDIWIASFLGSVASAIQCNNIGNKPISIDELLNLIKEMQIK